MRLAKPTAVMYAGFVLTGMATTLLGPVLPALVSRWSLNDSQAGYLFAGQFFSSTAAVVLSSLILPRLGFALSLALSYVLLALGVGAIGVGPWPLGLVGAAVYGFGLGIIIPATNLRVSQTSGPNRAAALNLLNLAWGVGAVLLPAIVALAIRNNLLHLLLLMLAGACLIVAITLLLMTRGGMQPLRIAHADMSPVLRIWLSLAILLYLYVGVENAVAGWTAMYTARLHLLAGTVWAAAPSIFWGALLIGRGLAVPVLRRVSEARLLSGGLLLAACGLISLIGANSMASVVVGIATAGLGLSSVFPLLVARISQAFGEAGPYAAGPIFAFGGIGGATVPWLVGIASQRGGGLRAGLVVPLAAVLLMQLVLIFSTRLELRGAPSAVRL